MSETTPPATASPHRVLLVDDDKTLLLALEQVVRGRRPDIDIDTCTSGTGALERITEVDYDAVITDVRMRGMDGLELVERIREVRPACVTVLISGVEQHDLALRALRAGAYDLLEKPVGQDVFVAAVVRAVETRKLRRDNEEKQNALARHAEELARELAEAVGARTRELEEANRMKDEFFTALSHELRTPLTAVLGWARLARSGDLDPAVQAKALESIEHNARSLGQLIDDLLDVSRIIAGKVRLTLVGVDVPCLVASVVGTLLPEARAKRITIEAPSAIGIPRVKADPDRLEQVLRNLVANGIKFTPEGGRITVAVEHHGANVEIRIRDTGIGIRSEFLPLVFDRFRQEDASRGRGLGLGLAIVRQLVELHGGTVSAASAGDGKGATFTVSLPVLQAADAPKVTGGRPSLRSHPDGAPAQQRCLDGVRVLVVEDEADVRDLLTVMLRKAGAVVAAAATAEEAYACVVRDKPAVMLCDLGLPDADGCDLLRRVRALPAARGGEVPALALTAYATSDDRTRALDAGFQAHLPKPGPPDLPHLVATLLSDASAARPIAPEDRSPEGST